ncbi:MAG: hypothetical protein ABIN54_08295 [candidate division WOR-3 bacterium]
MPYIMMSLALLAWPLAHIPLGAPLFLARNPNKELNFVLVNCGSSDCANRELLRIFH